MEVSRPSPQPAQRHSVPIVDSAMNVELLKRVRQTIARHPDRFCAAQWAFARNAEAVLRDGAVPEGFRCCIAGHVLLQRDVLTPRGLLREGGFHTGGGVWTRAARVASITEALGRELFFPSQWDRPYKQKYYLCARADEADLAAAYLDYFLEKYDGSLHDRPSESGASRSRAHRPSRSRSTRSSRPQTAASERPVAAGR